MGDQPRAHPGGSAAADRRESLERSRLFGNDSACAEAAKTLAKAVKLRDRLHESSPTDLLKDRKAARDIGRG